MQELIQLINLSITICSDGGTLANYFTTHLLLGEWDKRQLEFIISLSESNHNIIINSNWHLSHSPKSKATLFDNFVMA